MRSGPGRVEMVTREPDVLGGELLGSGSGAGGSIRSARGSEQPAPPGGRLAARGGKNPVSESLHLDQPRSLDFYWRASWAEGVSPV